MRSREEELRRLAKLAGVEDDPAVKQAIRVASLSRNPQWAARLERNLRVRAAQVNPDPHPFLPGPDAELAGAGEILLGGLVTGGAADCPVRMALDDADRHTMVGGPSGCGKTWTLMSYATQAHGLGTPFWWFDSTDEVSQYLLRTCAGVLVIGYRDFKFNLFQAPPGCDPEEYITRVTHLFRETMSFGDGMVNLVRDVCFGLLERKKVFSLGEVYQDIVHMRFHMNQRTARYHESVVNRLRELLQFMGKTYDTHHSDNIAELLKRSVVWRLHGLSDDHFGLFCYCLALWVMEYTRANR